MEKRLTYQQTVTIYYEDKKEWVAEGLFNPSFFYRWVKAPKRECNLPMLTAGDSGRALCASHTLLTIFSITLDARAGGSHCNFYHCKWQCRVRVFCSLLIHSQWSMKTLTTQDHYVFNEWNLHNLTVSLPDFFPLNKKIQYYIWTDIPRMLQ